jgi:hypothetical protein
MEAFWFFWLTLFVLSAFFKSERARKDREAIPEHRRNTVRNRKAMPKREVKEVLSEAEKQRRRDIEDLRKQGFSDDIITMIIPTINNGQ